jgi:CRP-like cAMP-binding protein
LAIARRVEILSRVPLFEGLSKRQLEAIARAVSVSSFSEGNEIVVEGSRANFCCVLVEGRVEVVKGDQPVAHLGPGEIFGEIALFDPGPRSATIRALTEVVAIQIPSQGFAAVATADPQIPLRMLKVLAHRIRETTESVIA